MRSWISLLLALLLIACCGILPNLAGEITDRMNRNQTGTAAIHTVELAVSGDEQDTPGYMLRKLALERDMTTLPIAPDQAAMTEEEVIAAAMAGMDIYIDAGIFEWFDFTYQAAEPYLGIQPSDRNNHAIFWSVTIVNDDAPYNCLFLHIDDETGKILYIRYETAQEREFADPEARQRMAEYLRNTFLSPLDLLPAQLTEYENLKGYVTVETTADTDSTEMVCTYRDVRYGEIRVMFHILPTGFYVAFLTR